MNMVLFKRQFCDVSFGSKMNTPTQRNALQRSFRLDGITRGKKIVNCVVSSNLAIIGILGASRIPFAKAAPTTTRALLTPITASSDLQEVAVSA